MNQKKQRLPNDLIRFEWLMKYVNFDRHEIDKRMQWEVDNANSGTELPNTLRDASMFLKELEGELPVRGMEFSAKIAGMLSRRLRELLPNKE